MPRHLLALAVACTVTPLPTAWASDEPAQETPAPDETGERAPGDGQAEQPVTTRAEEWRRRREARREGSDRYRPGLFERLMLAGDKGRIPNPYGWNLWGFYPRIQTIAAGSSIAGGVRFWQPDIGGSPVSVHGSSFRSVAGYQLHELQVGRIPHSANALPLRHGSDSQLYEIARDRLDESQLLLYVSLQYRHFTRLDYYGTGPDSREADRTSFLGESLFSELRAGYQLGRHTSLVGRVGWIDPSIGPGERPGFPGIEDLFDETTAPGLGGQPDFLVAGGRLLVDLRDEPGNPHSGVMLETGYARFGDRDTGAFGFDSWTADLRGYLPLGSYQRVLAVRAWVHWDEPTGESGVPFYLQRSLGGPGSLRGHAPYRFRGEKLLLLQAEYRWEAAPAVEAAFFVDSATISRPGEDLDTGDLVTDWGFGLRFKTWRSTFLRLEVATGNEGSRFVFGTGAAF